MATVDPYAPIRDWQDALYRSNEAVIDRFLNRIDETLPPGWVRDAPYEQTRPKPARTRCYLLDQPADGAIRLWLERVTATRVRGDFVQVIRYPPLYNFERIGQLVTDFAECCVLPATKHTGADCTHPRFGPRSANTDIVESMLRDLADTADGNWPLTGHLQESWDDLITFCLAKDVGFDRGELEQWLADSGWEKTAVAAIADRFFAESAWLAKRLEVYLEHSCSCRL